ncbi:MAG: regulatory protein RecX [Alphaproteobacteria bacterium]|nr:regulatory protein RecX [Alphaproteobacteria bacterium]
MFEAEEKKKTVRVLKKITQKRLHNIALYYLKRFETSTSNLKSVLRKRIDKYAFQNPDYDKAEAYAWADEIVADCEKRGYVNDERYAGFRVGAYVNAGKSARYIKGKLREKGISEDTIEELLEEKEYSPFDAALRFAKKKRIGPYRVNEEDRVENKQKDLQKLALAGFDYDTASEVLEFELED